MYLIYSDVISEDSALLSKILKYVNMNILDKYLDIKTEYVRCLSHS